MLIPSSTALGTEAFASRAAAAMARLPEEEGKELLRRRVSRMWRAEPRDLIDVYDEPQIAERLRGHPRDDVLAQRRDDELPLPRVAQSTGVHDAHGHAVSRRGMDHRLDVERRSGGEEE